MKHGIRIAYGLRGKAVLGLSLMALSLAIGGGYVLTPATAHAQIFGDDEDDEEIPGQQPTDNTIWDAKKLQKLDRNVRKLERAIARNDPKKGAPPIIIEPDPEVVALQATVDILSRKQDEQSATITRLTGQLEEAQHQNQTLQQTLNAAMTRMDGMMRRTDLVEAHMRDIDALLAPPPPPPASTGDPEADFEQAFNLMTSGQTDDADRAFEAFTQTWPEAPQLPEAWFRLGQIRAMKGDNSGAVAAYATALKGWPKTSWAPEATVKLADALTSSNRPTEACAALVQFDKLYAKTATSDARTLAKNLKLRDKCPA